MASTILTELRTQLVTRLEASTNLSTILGTDENDDKPIYQSHHPTAPTVTKLVVFEIRAGRDTELNVSGRRNVELEITAEVKPDVTTPDAPEDILDDIEEAIDAQLVDWKFSNSKIKIHAIERPTPSVPTFDLTGQGWVGRTWIWDVILDVV